MNDVLKIILVLALAYVALSAFVYFKQASLIYYPDLAGRTIVSTPENIGLAFEDVQLTTHDKIKLHGWFIPHEEARGTVLFFHGNAGNISHRLDSIDIFHRLQLNVMIIDYRGYGQSEGHTSEQGTYKDALAAWEFLTQTKEIDEQQIIIFGRSLGGAIAAWLASQISSAGLIIESSFSSVPAMGQRLYPFLPVTWLAHIRYDTQSYVAQTICPKLILHSKDDDIIPFAEGENIFNSAREPKLFYTLQGNHNNGFIQSGENYVNAMDNFITDVLNP